MKKCTFYRCFRSKKIDGGFEAVKTEGFCDTVKDDTGNEITLCFHKESPLQWGVTEKTTGFKVCSGDTRFNALDVAMNVYINMVYEKLQDSSMDKYKEIIRKAYEVA